VLSDIQFAPGARNVVYFSSESGQSEVWGASYPGFTTRRKISASGGRFPRLVKNGREVVYRALDGTFLSAALHMGSVMEAGAPKLLFRVSSADAGRFSVTPDGERFLIDEPLDKFEAPRPDILVVVNWAAGLR
jgi:hypothetical protein